MDLQEATYDDLVRACRQAEIENRRLKDENARLNNLAADNFARASDALAELAGWKRVAVEAAIPLEGLRMARPASDFSPSMRDGIEHAIGIIRRAVAGEGLPTAPSRSETTP